MKMKIARYISKDIRMLKIFAIIVFSCFLPLANLFAQRIKLDKVNNIRIGSMIYRDTTTQRGVTLRLDWISNKFVDTQYYGVFSDLDFGLAYKAPKSVLNDEGTTYNNSRQDIGLTYGVHMISNIRSRFYSGLGFGWSHYKFTDSSKIEPYVYNAPFLSFHIGAEVRLKKTKGSIFVELYTKRLPHRGDDQFAYEDSFELQRANVDRWIVGYSYPIR